MGGSHCVTITMIHQLFAQTGILFHPSQVSLPLFGRHRATDLKEMFQHFGLAGGPHLRPFTEHFFNLRRHLRSGSQGLGKVVVHLINATAPLHALWQIASVKLGDSLEFRVAQVELVLEPREFRLGAVHHRARLGGAHQINATVGSNRSQYANHQNQ